MPQKRIRNGKTRWVARYKLPNGKDAPSRTFDTRREALAYENERKRDLRRGEWNDPNLGDITVGELTEERARVETHPNSARAYRLLRKNLGRLGDMPVNAVRKTDVEEWHATLVQGRPWKRDKDGAPSRLAPTTAETWLNMLKGVFNRAVAAGRIPSSPGAGVSARVPGVKVTPRQVPTAVEVQQIIRYAQQGVRRPPPEAGGRHNSWVVQPQPVAAEITWWMAVTGMRPSEACGLCIDDLVPAAGVVNLSLQASPDGRRRVPLKNAVSERTISVDAETMARVRQWAAAHPHPDGRVFVRDNGRPASEGWLSWFYLRLREVGVLREGVTPHSLRHFHATTLIGAGASVKAVQARLGHGSAKRTLDTYTHFFPDLDVVSRDAAAAVLGGPVGDGGGLEAVN